MGWGNRRTCVTVSGMVTGRDTGRDARAAAPVERASDDDVRGEFDGQGGDFS